jgi:uncharacterized membrane protein
VGSATVADVANDAPFATQSWIISNVPFGGSCRGQGDGKAEAARIIGPLIDRRLSLIADAELGSVILVLAWHANAKCRLTTAVRGKSMAAPPYGNGEDRAGLPAGTGPTYPPPPQGLSPVLERNIRALQVRRQREEKEATLEERLADAITRFTGSMRFVYLHLVVFGFWIVANLGWVPGVPAWDPSFIVLAMIASVEAIFLSTFVLISQNRMAAAADKRADLDLQISLLAEHEVTRLVTLVSGIADRMGVRTEADSDLDEITQDVAPEAVLDELEAAEPGAEQRRDI